MDTYRTLDITERVHAICQADGSGKVEEIEGERLSWEKTQRRLKPGDVYKRQPLSYMQFSGYMRGRER